MTRHPWNVACPSCGSGVGRPCVDLVYGYPMQGYHGTRVDAASGGR